MENQGQRPRNAFLPIIGLYILVSILLRVFMTRLEENGINTNVLQAGNLFLVVIFLLSTWMQRNAMANASTHVFLRNVYGGLMLKLFGGAIAAFIYIYLANGNVNKPALFGTMFLYLVYTVLELRVVLKKSKSA
jgi:hypothetical protein